MNNSFHRRSDTYQFWSICRFFSYVFLDVSYQWIFFIRIIAHCTRIWSNTIPFSDKLISLTSIRYLWNYFIWACSTSLRSINHESPKPVWKRTLSNIRRKVKANEVKGKALTMGSLQLQSTILHHQHRSGSHSYHGMVHIVRTISQISIRWIPKLLYFP